MTAGDLLFMFIFAPLAALAIYRTSRGEGVEIPGGRQLSALAIAGVVLAAVGEFAVWFFGESN